MEVQVFLAQEEPEEQAEYQQLQNAFVGEPAVAAATSEAVEGYTVAAEPVGPFAEQVKPSDEPVEPSDGLLEGQVWLLVELEEAS